MHCTAAQGPNPEHRRQVEGGGISTPNYGLVALDPEPDQRLVRYGEGRGQGSWRLTKRT